MKAFLEVVLRNARFCLIYKLFLNECLFIRQKIPSSNVNPEIIFPFITEGSFIPNNFFMISFLSFQFLILQKWYVIKFSNDPFKEGLSCGITPLWITLWNHVPIKFVKKQQITFLTSCFIAKILNGASFIRFVNFIRNNINFIVIFKKNCWLNKKMNFLIILTRNKNLFTGHSNLFPVSSPHVWYQFV